MSIAVVVPTCRPDRLADFMAAWRPQFEKHACDVIVVRDDTESCEVFLYGDRHSWRGEQIGTAGSILGEDESIVPRKSPACRCIGFAAIARDMPHVSQVVTLDDDLEPDGDTIGDHSKSLGIRVPVSWLSSSSYGYPYMRGFPYGIRAESPVWVSHGVWQNIPDLDAPSQLVLGDRPEVRFYQGPVPRGVYFPVCGMNLAFVRQALPLMYWAPAKWLRGAERFDDIWMGIYLVRELEEAGAALVTGFASCVHTRLSNTMKNLQQEALGIEVNESLWSDGPQSPEVESFLRRYEETRRRWKERLSSQVWN